LGYALIPEVRDLIGLTTDDIDSSDLGDLIDLSTQMMIEDLTLAVRDEEPSGNINGSNTTFSIDYYPVADTSGNKTVGSEDITVYTWTDEDDPSTKSSVSVSTIYERDGKVILSSAPVSTVSKITIDYSYTFEEALNWELIKVACSYLVGYLFSIRKFTVLPDSYARGPMRFRHFTKPYDQYLSKYYEIMNLIKSTHHIKKAHDEMVLQRKRM